ncbi:MAG: MFS transporter [Clostridiales bacterium]|nr:MFS transporter [Clostridiales bacterium]MDY4541795.1 MFS transporter [Candidatus Ventricola sp.]
MLKHYTKEEKSWIFYDWANSAFSAIVAAIILPVFFKSMAESSGVSAVDATAYWGYATSLGTLICAVLAPFLGTLGDFRGMKKKLFTAFMLLGVVSTFLLALTNSWQGLLLFYVLGTLGFSGSCIYYDSFLLDVTDVSRMDRVSSVGYGLGYIGGSTIPLVVSLVLIQFGSGFGIPTMLATKFSFILTAVWWLVFTIPMLRHVQQKHAIEPDRDMFAHTLRNMKDTLSMIVKNRSILFFVIAYFFYIDGVGTIIHMATVFGSSCGLDSMDLMVVLLVVQIVAFPFAILYGRLADRFGSRKMILFGIATYIVVCMLGFNLKEMKDFLLLAVLVGTAQGGIQALSRSFYGKLVPAEHASEYFGFFDVFGKFSAVIGPALFGVVAQLTGVTNYGALAVMFMFILGGAIFMFLVPRNAEKA